MADGPAEFHPVEFLLAASRGAPMAAGKHNTCTDAAAMLLERLREAKETIETQGKRIEELEIELGTAVDEPAPDLRTGRHPSALLEPAEPPDPCEGK